MVFFLLTTCRELPIVTICCDDPTLSLGNYYRNQHQFSYISHTAGTILYITIQFQSGFSLIYFSLKM